MKTVRTTVHDGREYRVETDEEKINEPLCSYCQVRRIRRDRKIGMRITDIAHVYSILQAAKNEKPIVINIDERSDF